MTNNQRFKALRQFSCVECGSRPVDIAHSNFSEHKNSINTNKNIGL